MCFGLVDKLTRFRDAIRPIEAGTHGNRRKVRWHQRMTGYPVVECLDDRTVSVQFVAAAWQCVALVPLTGYVAFRVSRR